MYLYWISFIIPSYYPPMIPMGTPLAPRTIVNGPSVSGKTDQMHTKGENASGEARATRHHHTVLSGLLPTQNETSGMNSTQLSSFGLSPAGPLFC